MEPKAIEKPNDKPKVIDELFLLRAVACLSIVLLHCIHRIYGDDTLSVRMLTLLMTFGTPTFVFISEFILSHSYPNSIPRDFWGKRLSYILVPYVLFGIFYAGMKAVEASLATAAPLAQTFAELSLRHVLIGDYHGYFILIIFQFYCLHRLFQVYIQRYSAKLVLSISLVINLAYLGFFNFTEPMNIPYADYIWSKFYWVPCLGWLFYFTLAYYCGRNYEAFKEAVRRNGLWIMAFLLVASAAPLYLLQQGILKDISSKRVDMLFFTVAMSLFLFYIALRLKDIPRWILTISRYSFGIYLFHPLYLAVMVLITRKVPLLDGTVLGVVVMLFGSTIGSIVTLHILNKWSWGPYFAGKVGKGKRDIGSKEPQPLTLLPKIVND
jgi:membrane-bound acyltransferase YfiQ involved in biofilm formation